MSSFAVSGVELGHRLAQLRKGAGLKQVELARKVTWSQAVLSRIETGERTISSDELTQLFEAIGTQEAAALAEILDRNWQHITRPTLDHPDQERLWRAEQMIVRLLAERDVPGTPPAFRVRLEEYVKEIARIAGLLLRRDHQIAFIGSIGIGKSTAICRATGLETAGPQGLISVLETGAGGITLCEVHLKSGPGYGIAVVPRSHDDIRSDVMDFVELLIPSSQAAAGDDEASSVPRELDRAIRNMAGLVKRRTVGPDGKKTTTDPAKVLTAEFPDRRDLVVEILTRMDLPRRDRRDDWHSPTHPAAPLEWLRTTFEQINNGRHPDFSLPARIDLVVPELLSVDDLDVSIVDTRGIDQPSSRADLETLLEDPHTVAILCSGFNDAPAQPIHHLLQRARDIDNTQIDSHTGVLVLARPGEALEAKDEDGSHAETADDGYEIKGDQIRNALARVKLSECPTHFFNAREDDPGLLREFLRSRVTQTRQAIHTELESTLERTESLLENAAEEQVQAVQRQAAQLVTAWINQNTAPKHTGEHVHDTLLQEIGRAHPSSVNASARRGGEWQSLSYAHQLGFGARKAATAALQESVAGFASLCRTAAEPMPEASGLLSQAHQLMVTAYNELLRKVQLTGSTAYSGELKQSPQFWSDNMNEWGQGTGYIDRVLERNRQWFRHNSRRVIEQNIEAVIDREWAAALRRVEAIFEQA